MASRRIAHYIGRAGLPGTTGAIIPGALSILQGAVPVRARGFGHMAPTYFRREPGIERSNGRRGSALLCHYRAGAKRRDPVIPIIPAPPRNQIEIAGTKLGDGADASCLVSACPVKPSKQKWTSAAR